MNLIECSINDLNQSFEAGDLSSVELCQYYLKRIDAIDRSGPTLRSIIEVNPEILKIAEGLDKERREGKKRSPLHGIPILVKDSIDTADQMMTTAGSLALEGNYAPKDAFLIQKLRQAGAVILGKANMSEWGYMRSTRACSGWSSRGGQVKNPYVLDRSPLGTSSGSAAAVAANLCVASIGAEVDGSIVRPASSNCIVGLKPTVGLISRSGIIGVASPQDTAGPMARSVSDLAILLNALVGYDPLDPATDHPFHNKAMDYRKFLDPKALKGARLGVARECFGKHEGTDAVIKQAISVLKSLGAEIVDPIQASTLPFFGELELELFLYGIKHSINHYLSSHPRAQVKSLKELIRFNKEHATQVMPYLRQEFFEKAIEKNDLHDPRYLEIVTELRRLSRTDGIDLALQRHDLDAIIAPTEASPPFVIDPIVGDHILSGGCSTPPAVAGYPHISLPAGYVDGLPVGLSFFSGAFQEGKLLGYAYAFEQETKIRRLPTYQLTID